MISPAQAIRPKLSKAVLLIEHPSLSREEATVPVCFNPSEFQIQKQNTFADIEIPGLETPPIQFIRGSGEKLSADLLVDTSDTLKDVRTEYVDKIRNLMKVRSELHAPPIVKLIWGPNEFRGVVESLTITYTLFSDDGKPLRAKISLTLKEYRNVKVQLDETPRNSPDVEKLYIANRGETLGSIAFRVYRDCSLWRVLAIANQIQDPRRLSPGTRLIVPKLDLTGAS